MGPLGAFACVSVRSLDPPRGRQRTGHLCCSIPWRVRKELSAVGCPAHSCQGRAQNDELGHWDRNKAARTRTRNQKIEREKTGPVSATNTIADGRKAQSTAQCPHEGARLLLGNEGSNQKTNGPPPTCRDSPTRVATPAGARQRHGSTRPTAAAAAKTVYRWPAAGGQSSAPPPPPAPDPRGTTTPA